MKKLKSIDHLSEADKKELAFEMRGKKGFSVRKNKGNGFQVISCWFWAHPGFRTEEWQKAAFAGLDKKTIDLEYYGERIVYGGTPVFSPDFNRAVHVLATRKEADPDFPILRGWDFGGNHAVVTCQYIGGVLYVLDEWANLGYNTRKIAKDIISDCFFKYPENRYFIDFIDPSGLWDNSKASTGLACGQILTEEYKLQVIPGIQEVSKRIDSVMRLLVSMQGGVPCLQINPECQFLINGFERAYHYPDKETKTQKVMNPEKNHPYSDLHDCLQYVCTRLVTMDSMVATASMGVADSGDGYGFET